MLFHRLAGTFQTFEQNHAFKWRGFIWFWWLFASALVSMPTFPMRPLKQEVVTNERRITFGTKGMKKRVFVPTSWVLTDVMYWIQWFFNVGMSYEHPQEFLELDSTDIDNLVNVKIMSLNTMTRFVESRSGKGIYFWRYHRSMHPT